MSGTGPSATCVTTTSTASRSMSMGGQAAVCDPPPGRLPGAMAGVAAVRSPVLVDGRERCEGDHRERGERTRSAAERQQGQRDTTSGRRGWSFARYTFESGKLASAARVVVTAADVVAGFHVGVAAHGAPARG